MSDEKTQADPQQAKTASEEQPPWSMPFPEMMAKMMARCGCRPDQMDMNWAAYCCDMFAAKKEDPKKA